MSRWICDVKYNIMILIYYIIFELIILIFVKLLCVWIQIREPREQFREIKSEIKTNIIILYYDR